MVSGVFEFDFGVIIDGNDDDADDAGDADEDMKDHIFIFTTMYVA